MDSRKAKPSNWWEPKYLTGECYTEEGSTSVTSAGALLSPRSRAHSSCCLTSLKLWACYITQHTEDTEGEEAEERRKAFAYNCFLTSTLVPHCLPQGGTTQNGVGM